ncbi:LuxS/MPP-like metallohydrolase [Trametes versicolor FP-101664 SS1]|uniref:LuxS/MPP-like metallohydrolase n=1 Tax=Trametes versicolor (strain FP-101664) TaxID=717944 RepID=UPI00046240B9|nr:LuxS/MPP-like metallohydrolase [Trametes versicolor FP-101664 SS1]EIW56019.1 LuxS/MPP-like metallohydrolase [Trametes versicolor FP-101664 SS1]
MSTWKDVPSAGDVPGYRLFMGEVEKPALDERQYRLVELPNGLRAVFVHDATADKAAACLALATGSMMDPDDAPGLAHFCEHMISKGSEPYPAENDFLSFISANGGSRNAATGPTYTEYWFSIRPTELAGGLPRLAAFFHAPLFTESLTAREINAVDSEFKRNLQNDPRRVLQITKNLSVQGHPWRKFGTGNYVSLSDAGRREGEQASEEVILKETRRRLVAWWQREYCASRMTLAVIGKESLEKLFSLAVPHFAKIPNRALEPRPAFKNEPWGVEHMGTVIFVQTVKDFYAFDVCFQLPDLREHYETKPASFLAHFFGHEGPGSICAFLKKKGWLSSLSSGPSGSSRSVQFFKVHGQLTFEGYLHYREVLEAVFNYISLLRASPLSMFHFTEVSTMAATRFRFKEKAQPQSYASTLAHALAEPYPPEQLLSGAHLYRDWDESLVRQVLDGFVPERVRVTLQAKTHHEDVVRNDVEWVTEKWYGTQYAVQKMDQELIQKLGRPNANQELHLPTPNPFIPEDLDVKKVEVPGPAKHPLLAKRTELSQLWHKKDDQFWVPKAHVRIDVKSPLAYATPRHAMLSRVLVDLIDDALAQVTYDADLAGLSYSVTNQIEGLTVSVSGYNDKIPVLLRIVLEKIRGLQVQPDRLRVVKEEIQREYENFYMSQPSALSESYATWMFMPTIWTPAEKLPELPLISESDVERHRDDLLSKVFIEALVNGNLTQGKSLGILSLAEECLKARPLLPGEIPRQRSLVLPPGSDVVSRKRHTNPKEINSSLSYYLQFGEVSDVRLRCTLALIAHMMREPCYSILRTEEQLGYVVGSSPWSINSTRGLGIRIQSVRPPWFLESRVDAFLETFGDRVAEMSPDEFTRQKEGLIVKKLESAKNLHEETSRFWAHIRSGYYDFLRHEEDASLIRELALPEVVATYDALVRPSTGAKTRKKLSVHLLSQEIREAPPAHPSAASDIDASPNTDADVSGTAEGAVRPASQRTATLVAEEDPRGEVESAFKAGLGCAPAATPVISAAFGGYEHGLASGASAHATARGGGADCAAPASSRL